MAYRYVPPALRGQGQGGNNANVPSYRNSGTSMPSYPVSSGLRGGDSSNRPQRRRSDLMPDEEVYSLKDINRHFWPEDESKAMPTETSKTLHDSAATPRALSYMLLFKDANPRWETDEIIFTKSSLDLLPANLAEPTRSVPVETPVTDVEDVTPNSASTSAAANDHPNEHQASPVEPNTTVTDPTAKAQPKECQSIAIFTQIRRPPYNSNSSVIRSFKFLGYYRVARLQFLEPRTPELAKMLDQKWTIVDPRTGRPRARQREGQGWEKSFSLRWAVVKFEKDEEADKVRGKPDIKRLADEEDDGGGGEKKSVNELLKELRVKDGDAEAKTETTKQDDEEAKLHDANGQHSDSERLTTKWKTWL